MVLRFAAGLLTVLWSINLHAADEVSPAADTQTGSPTKGVGQPDGGDLFQILDRQQLIRLAKLAHHCLVCEQRTQADADQPLVNKVDSLFRNQDDSLQLPAEREFPFSPRPIRQFNYDTGIAQESLETDGFLFETDMLPNGNTDALRTSETFIIQAAGNDGLPILQLVECEGSGACFGRVAMDDRPIDVLLAEEDDCEAPATAHVPEPAPDLPPGPVPSPAAWLLNPVLGRTGFVLTGAQPLPGNLLIAGTAANEPDAPATAAQPDDAAHRTAERPWIKRTSGISDASSSDACSQAEPPLKAKVEHLLEAARHLAGAGYEEEAKLFRVEAEAIQNASTRLLTEKRQELERLQQEIAELEALTGQYQMIQINCRIMELSLPENCEAGAHLEALEQPGIHVLTGQPCSNDAETPSRLLTGEELARALHAMEQHSCGTLKTLAEPVIVTMNGRPATLRSGGEFPILIPVSGASGDSKPQAAIEWKDFGVKMQAVPFIQGNGKVRLALETEIADRDFTNAVNVHGAMVPGLTTRRCRTDVEAQFGETVAIALNSAPEEQGRRSLLVLVTARQIEPPAERHEQ